MGLADAVMAVHVLLVLFNVGGLAAVIAGGMRGWHWVRNAWFRWTHLALAVFVAFEALFGITCPLTVLEDALRGDSSGESFIGRWLRAALYWNVPPWAFGLAYFLFAALVVWAWRKWPPRKA